MPFTGSAMGPPISFFGETGPDLVATRYTWTVAPGTIEVILTRSEHWSVGTMVGAERDTAPVWLTIGYALLMVISPCAAGQESQTAHAAKSRRPENEALRGEYIRVLLADVGCTTPECADQIHTELHT